MADHYLKQELYETLRHDTTIFKFLQEGALDGIWYWDLEKPENEWMSPRFWELLGFDPKKKKHLASEWQDLIFPEDLKTAIENFEKHCADENHAYDQIVRYKHKDGSTVWVRCRGIAIRNEKGKPIRMLGAHNDLTHLKRAEEELKKKAEKLQWNEAAFRQEKERIHNIGDNIPAGQVFQLMILPDGTRRFTHVSRQVEELYECTVEEALKDSGFIYDRMLEEDNTRIRKASAKAFREGKVFDQEFRVRLNSGEIRWHRTVANPRGLEDGSILFDGIDIDITEQKLAGQEREALLEELKEKNVQLEHAATHDFLTGLPNRVLLYDRFLQNASICRRSGLKMGVCIADTDYFKLINDTYGHQEGDRVLKEIGSRIQPSLREYDTTARLGGDEFALLLLNVREKKEIEKIMARMLKNANQQIPVGKKFIQVSMSVGIAVYPDDGDTLDELLGKADQAMYRAKDSGGNRYLFFHQEK